MGGGLLSPFRGELGPRLTQCRLGQGLRPYRVVYLDPSNRLATIRQRYSQDRETGVHLPEAEYICPAGFLCGWPVGVELVAGLPETPGSQQRHFLQAPKDVFVCSVLIYIQHISGFTTMRYINLRFTYLLTYRTGRTTVP